MYIRTKKSDWNPNSNTLEPDRPRHDRSAAHVIAQQCSSANFVSLRFLFARITTARLSKVLLSQSRLFYFSKIACMKLLQSVSVCTCVCVGADNMCVCVCVCEREREISIKPVELLVPSRRIFESLSNIPFLLPVLISAKTWTGNLST